MTEELSILLQLFLVWVGTKLQRLALRISCLGHWVVTGEWPTSEQLRNWSKGYRWDDDH